MDTMVNIPLLRKAVEWVEEQNALPINVRVWNQRTWVYNSDCGTTYCVAGKITHDLYPEWSAESVSSCAMSVAQEALKLTDDEARSLFQSDNSAVVVREIAEKIAGERL